ncbi:actin-related protein RO7 [Aspergillus sclerotialis]|uniref:Actin-related protein RO7 n=1 Tax=Aspergillus sclerotialis TaxID=2070753 RepID=A0A3A3A602_9EURO|nr:actin-related protein RO7 [Aspergillus sclerotialis]
MASTPSGHENKRSFTSSSNLQSSLRYGQSARPSSPHTPQQHIRSTCSSFATSSPPGASYRSEEDAIIFELGTRWIRAGFEGNNTPICVTGFGPEESRRVGDYRGWISGSSYAETSPVKLSRVADWASAYELWRMDLRDVDLGLIEDKIERVFRDIYNKYLLADAGTSRLVLVVPSVIPHPLLSSVLSTLFSRWRFPSITLLPTATMSAAAAGVRSALVVDLGWAETTATGIYEYREVATRRSTRAMKTLLQEMGKFLTKLASEESQSTTSANHEDEISVNFEYCEEVVSRLAWCRHRQSTTESNEPTDQYSSLLQKNVSIPSPSKLNSTYIDVHFSNFAEPVEKVLFGEGIREHDLDDEEKPIPLLIYNTLLSLPPDARGVCMSRIIFIGGGSKIPGVRRRILQEVDSMIKEHGWSPVRGKVIERQRQRLENLTLSKQRNLSGEDPANPLASQASQPTDQAEQKQEEEEQEQEAIDFVEQKLRRANKDKSHPPQIRGIVREVESLGAWAGASLVTSLKVRGMVEIDREKFLQHGLAGASRDLESHGHIPDRRSGLRSGGDRSSWTLGGWG